MTNRRLVLLGAATLVVGVALAAVGRWEEAREADRQNAAMQSVLDKVGLLSATLPTGYRFGPPNCLAYSLPDNELGLEVCFDAFGRVVETADRSGVQPEYASLVYDPSRATIRVPRVLVDRLFEVAEKHGR